MSKIFKQLSQIIPLNKTSSVLITLCLLLLIWGGIRSCSEPTGFDRSRTFTIARDPSWYPLNLMGKEKNVLAFTNDLILTIAKRRNVRIQLMSVGSNSLFNGLNDEEYDAVISSLVPNAINNRIYNFSHTFFLVGPVLIVPKNFDFKSMDNMSNKIIGIDRNLDSSFKYTKYKIYYKPYENMTMAFNDLYEERIDGIFMPVLQAFTYTNTFHKGEFKIVTPPLSRQGLRLVTRQTEASSYVITEFNIGLQEMIDDGSYGDLCKKWGITNPFDYSK
ncbi:MAG: transporter substrate-binding domain-containing protein [Chlamydiota bacterium]|nr:transporter substrate-binding domain-containing protein [Chlamydiota bacterium]